MGDRAGGSPVRTAPAGNFISENTAGVAGDVAFSQRPPMQNPHGFYKKARKRTVCRLDLGVSARSALSGFLAEVLFELAGFVLVLLRVGRCLTLAGDVRPFGGVGPVDLQPLLHALLGVGNDRLGRAFRLADAAV